MAARVRDYYADRTAIGCVAAVGTADELRASHASLEETFRLGGGGRERSPRREVGSRLRSQTAPAPPCTWSREALSGPGRLSPRGRG
jgi:hypothetical protein